MLSKCTPKSEHTIKYSAAANSMPAKTIDCGVTRALRDPEKFLEHGEYCENEIWDRAEEENEGEWRNRRNHDMATENPIRINHADMSNFTERIKEG